MPLKIPAPQSNNEQFASPKRAVAGTKAECWTSLCTHRNNRRFQFAKSLLLRWVGHCRSLGLFGNEGSLPLAARAGLDAPLRLDSPRVAPLDGTLPWRALPSRWPGKLDAFLA